MSEQELKQKAPRIQYVKFKNTETGEIFPLPSPTPYRDDTITFAKISHSNALFALQSGALSLRKYYELYPEPKEAQSDE